jgi:protein involved in polysaccharide export with SLBB domain
MRYSSIIGAEGWAVARAVVLLGTGMRRSRTPAIGSLIATVCLLAALTCAQAQAPPMMMGHAAGPTPPGVAAPGMPSLTPSSLLLPATLPGGGTTTSAVPDALQQEILQRLLGAAGGRPAALPPRTVPPTLTPSPPIENEPLSPVEAFFAARDQPPGPAGVLPPAPLRQIGYDSLRSALPSGPPAGLGFGVLPQDYLLGRDDELVLAFRGRVRNTVSLRVGRDGTLLVPDLPPIPAAGRTLRELRADLEARAAQDLGGSEVFVSVGQIRQIAIFVGGEVARPGLQALTAHASVLDALVAAGGVRRTGSLRAIRVEGAGPSRTIDLYPVIIGAGGPPPDLTLREGERILVPPLGGAVALGGEITRPGIYELPSATAAQPLESMLLLAGQTLRPAGNRYLLSTTDAGGRRSLQEISARDLVRRGDAIRVQPGTDAAANMIRVAGHVAPTGTPVLRAAGAGRGRSLRSLLADPLLVRPDPYPALGVVWRTDRRSRARHFLAFDLARVMRGEADLPLLEGDEVIVIGLADVFWLSSPQVAQAVRGEVPTLRTPSAVPGEAPRSTPVGLVATIATGLAGDPPQGADPAPGLAQPDCLALQQVAIAAQSSRLRFAHARGGGFPDIGRTACPPLFHDYPALLPFLLDQTVMLAGEVRLPGLYPVVAGTSLDRLAAIAGGATESADLGAIELGRETEQPTGPLPLIRAVVDLRQPGNLAATHVRPRDAVRVPRKEAEREAGPITLVGEFIRPGVYDIRRGERLSEVIARAGGLTPQAFPYGAVFSRETVRQRQQEGFLRTARELEQGLMQVAIGQAVVSSRSGGGELAAAIQAGRTLADSLRQARAAGRMVVEANPVMLASRPELDVLLEPGDLLAMPKRPGEVTVVGAVLNPGSLQFASGWRAADYVRAAGGRQRFADGGRAFVILPNGQSVPAGQAMFQDGGPPVPPGSVVVVPQDPSPFETRAFLRDVTQIASQLAISAAALAVVSGAAR